MPIYTHMLQTYIRSGGILDAHLSQKYSLQFKDQAVERAAKDGFICSMSKKGDCYDNASMGISRDHCH